MSRLDSVIRRLQAQRACLECATDMIQNKSGLVLELGLGNGRTYDHLREKLPEREIYVFEREVNAHPDCIPSDTYLIMGDMQKTLPIFKEKHPKQAVLLHSDIGTGDAVRNQNFARWLETIFPDLICAGGVILSDQKLNMPDFKTLSLPENVDEGRYYFYQKQD